VTNFAKTRGQWPVISGLVLICGRVRNSILGKFYLLITPLPPNGSLGIFDLGQNADLIYGLQSLRGKSLSRQELQVQSAARSDGSVSLSGKIWVKLT
jgi:hypothetical protein